jgi:hypothetical protein
MKMEGAPQDPSAPATGGLIRVHRRWWHPAWLRPPGAPEDPTHFVEARWPVMISVVVAVLLYVSLPDRLTPGPGWLTGIVECALLLPLLLTEPHWHPEYGRNWQRWVTITLFGVINLSNLISLGLLVDTLLAGGKATGRELIGEAVKIWLTNVLIFGFWYWELDRGGPRARHWRQEHAPDFLFPQMATPEIAHPHWMPTFVDYLYLSFTNSTAFSPTDTLPLTPAAKMLMLVQSIISLLTVALVAARAVNILS